MWNRYHYLLWRPTLLVLIKTFWVVYKLVKIYWHVSVFFVLSLNFFLIDFSSNRRVFIQSCRLLLFEHIALPDNLLRLCQNSKTKVIYTRTSSPSFAFIHVHHNSWVCSLRTEHIGSITNILRVQHPAYLPTLLRLQKHCRLTNEWHYICVRLIVV